MHTISRTEFDEISISLLVALEQNEQVLKCRQSVLFSQCCAAVQAVAQVSISNSGSVSAALARTAINRG
jgi:hypothetical protein